MATIPSGSVDMILCDLPYGTTQNKWDSVLPLDRLWAEYWRVTKPNVATGSMLHTDEHGGYRGIGGLFYQHETIRHGAGEYVRDGVSTNDIESVWAVLKRGLHGVYHHASPKHLGRYVDEFTFRLNDGNVKRQSMQRVDSLLRGAVGRRITYAELTA